jgi:hypothetical protein
MLRLKRFALHRAPKVLCLFALCGCASDTDLVAIGESAGADEASVERDLTLTDNPLAGPVVSPEGEVLPEARAVHSPEGDPLEVQLDGEAEFQRLVGSTLEDSERLALEHLFARRGLQPDDIQLVGRLVLEGHTYTVADDLLALSREQRLAEKGRVLGDHIETTAGTPLGLEQAASNLYARTQNGQFQFFRPIVTDKISYIVPSNNFLLTLMTGVVRTINDAASDCLVNGASGTLRAGTEANYAALDATSKARMTKVTISIGAQDTVCPRLLERDIQGCSLAPRKINILLPNGQTKLTMTAGGRIGLVNTFVTGQDSLSRRTAMHEVLHTLGIQHPHLRLDDADGDGRPTAIQVPGTSTNVNVLSVMQETCKPVTTDCSTPPQPACCNKAATNLSTEDVDMIDTLYSAQSGGSCAYVDEFTTVVAN